MLVWFSLDINGFAEALEEELGEKGASAGTGDSEPGPAQGTTSSSDQQRKEAESGESTKEDANKEEPPDDTN